MLADEEFAGFTRSQRAMLLAMVKECQKSQLRGSIGSWKEYVKAEVPALTKTDPSAHDWRVSVPSADQVFRNLLELSQI